MSEPIQVATEVPQEPSVQNLEASTSEAKSSSKSEEWMLEQASRTGIEKLIKSMKFGSESELKKFVHSMREREEENKSELQKLQEKARFADEAKAQLEERNSVLARYAESALEALAPAQRKAILGIAGEDPAKQLHTLEQMRKGGFLKEEPEPNEQRQVSEPAKAKTFAPPANTAAQSQAPKPAGPSDHDPLARYREYLKTNPVAAANYYTANHHDILSRMQQEGVLALPH